MDVWRRSDRARRRFRRSTPSRSRSARRSRGCRRTATGSTGTSRASTRRDTGASSAKPSSRGCPPRRSCSSISIRRTRRPRSTSSSPSSYGACAPSTPRRSRSSAASSGTPATGRETRIRRIYNRLIFDELEAKGVELPFDITSRLDLSWAGHPNWYFRWSKHCLPELHHPTVPEARFLSDVDSPPKDLENWVLKPLFSFARIRSESRRHARGPCGGPARPAARTLF